MAARPTRRDIVPRHLEVSASSLLALSCPSFIVLSTASPCTQITQHLCCIDVASAQSWWYLDDEDDNVPQAVVLEENQYLQPGDFVISPSGEFSVGLDRSGNFLLKDKTSRLIWSANTSRATRVFMQSDGNLIVKDSRNQALWSSRTYGNKGATLVVDDGGRIAIVKESTAVWFAGVPRCDVLESSSSNSSLSFPVRGIFYYPWYVTKQMARIHNSQSEQILIRFLSQIIPVGFQRPGM